MKTKQIESSQYSKFLYYLPRVLSVMSRLERGWLPNVFGALLESQRNIFDLLKPSFHPFNFFILEAVVVSTDLANSIAIQRQIKKLFSTVIKPFGAQPPS